MKFVSLFSGIEAASVAANPLGWEPLAFSETAKFPSALLAYHYPSVPNLGDITKAQWEAFNGKAGIVVGGSPCQAFSIAGLRQSVNDARANLTSEYVRAVHRIRPKWFLWENVPGIFTAKGNPFGHLLGGICGHSTEIAPPACGWQKCGFLLAPNEGGYSVAWRVLDAQHFGLAQQRRRVFLVGHLGNLEWWRACEVLFERPSQIFPFAQERGAGIAARTAGQTARIIANAVTQCIGPRGGCSAERLAETAAILAAEHSERLRMFTPLEIERLFGFPDNYTRIPYNGKGPELCPDTRRYEALGNTWAVPVVRWIFARINEMEKQCSKALQ